VRKDYIEQDAASAMVHVHNSLAGLSVKTDEFGKGIRRRVQRRTFALPLTPTLSP
jgi:hypothetical protein